MEMTATASGDLQNSVSDSPARDQAPRRDVHLVQPIAPRILLIRDLQQSDVSCLEWHGGEDLRFWYQAQWENHEAGQVHVLIADFNDFPVGQVAVHWHGKPTHPLVPDLQSLRVFGAFQGLGIGTVLLDCAEKLVAQAGHSQVSLAVGTENPRARALYERRGYRVFGEAYDDEWTYQNARGETCTACETVFDMVKDLSHDDVSDA
jgi:GNAT superfamily N-acetyltransferase